MLQHIVLLRFPQDLSDSEAEDMRAQVASFTEIECVKEVRLGGPSLTDWSRGYQYLMYIEISDLESLPTYLSHPAHVKFGKWTVEKQAEAIIFDYVIEEAKI